MITGFSIENFKSLARLPEAEDSQLPFGPINVLIGPNGCGKSSLLQAIDFLRAFFRSSVELYLQEHHWEYNDLPNLRQARKAIRWSLTAQLDADRDGRFGGEYRYSVSLQPKKHLGIGDERLTWKSKDAPHEERVLIDRQGRHCRYYHDFLDGLRDRTMISLPASIMSTWNSARDRRNYGNALHFRDWVERFRSFLIWDPKVLRDPSRGRHEELGSSGENLATIIGHLKEKHPNAFGKLVRRIRDLFPMVSDISVSGSGWGWRTIRLHESNGKPVAFNSQQMSDGVLRLLAVTAMLYLPKIPSVLMFEEPENGVHPQLLRSVVQILHELTQRKPPNRCQVFLTTHSPYVLDEFYDHPEQVYCMDRPGPQEGARILRLSENKQLRIARDTFNGSLGEAWFTGLIGATAGAKSS
jgi:predicted ATPase